MARWSSERPPLRTSGRLPGNPPDERRLANRSTKGWATRKAHPNDIRMMCRTFVVGPIMPPMKSLRSGSFRCECSVIGNREGPQSQNCDTKAERTLLLGTMLGRRPHTSRPTSTEGGRCGRKSARGFHRPRGAYTATAGNAVGSNPPCLELVRVRCVADGGRRSQPLHRNACCNTRTISHKPSTIPSGPTPTGANPPRSSRRAICPATLSAKSQHASLSRRLTPASRALRSERTHSPA